MNIYASFVLNFVRISRRDHNFYNYETLQEVRTYITHKGTKSKKLKFIVISYKKSLHTYL